MLGTSIMALRNRRRPARRLRKAAKKQRSSRVPRSLVTNPQHQGATIIETILVPAAVVTNSQIGLNIFDISLFNRAKQTASLYKFYKADWCEWEYQPRYNVYSTAGPTVPYMYYAMNRTQDSTIGLGPTTAQQFMTSQGCVPRKFTNKIVVRYRPNWCSPGLIAVRGNVGTGDINGIGSMGLRVQYGWVASPDNGYSAGAVNTVMPIADASGSIPSGFVSAPNFPQAVQYNGHYTWFDDAATEQNPVGDIVLRVKWSFKNPGFFVTGPRAEPPVKETGPTGEV